MTDHNLADHTEEQAAKTEALIHQAAEYMFNNFRWESRTAEVEEVLSCSWPELTKAHMRFMQGYALDLRLLFDRVAMELCQESAKRIIAACGDDWLVFLEGVDYE